MSSLKIVTLVSGGGRTVVNLYDRIQAGDLDAEIPLVIADRECKAVSLLRALVLKVELIPWTKETTADAWAASVWPRIEAAGADLVCNCGFLRLLHIPPEWDGRVMNIHPGLLPEFGGTGMYGRHVHRAVLDAGKKESGCTVHFANNIYDEGPIILEKRVPVEPDDSIETLAARVFDAECEAYPEAITLYAEGRLRIEDGKVSIQ